MNYPSWKPSINKNDNLVRVHKYFGKGNLFGYRAFNGTLFPSMNATKLFKIWNYFDHSKVWHKLSFEFKQDEKLVVKWNDNQWITNLVTISIAIFDMSELNTDNYPNQLGNTWKNSHFGKRSCITHDNSDESICSTSAFQLVLSQESINAGYVFLFVFHSLYFLFCFLFALCLICLLHFLRYNSNR